MELCGWRYRRMTRYIVEHISQCHLGRVQSALAQIYSYVRNRVSLHLHVRLYAAAVTYSASAASLELMCQRVWNMLLVAASRVLVVYCLYASAAGYVVFGHRKFERSIMRQFHGLLHQSLAEGACAHHHGAVQVLQRTARYLACRCCVAVNQHHYRHHGVNRLRCSLIFVCRALDASLGGDYCHILRYKHIDYLDSLCQRTAAVVTQVKQQTRHALAAHLHNGAAHIA